MQRYTGVSVVQATNVPLPGATITVFETGTLIAAAIFEDTSGSTGQANPFTSDLASGVFSFCAADGVYDILVQKTGYPDYTIGQVALNASGVGAQYFLGAAAAGLTEARLPVDTATIAWNLATANQFKANVVDGAIGVAQLAAGLATIKVWPVSIAHADILTSPTTPVIVVAAPGAGIRRTFLFALLTNNFAAGAYTNVGADTYAYFSHTGDEGTSLCSAYIPNGTSPALTQFTAFMGATVQEVSLLPYQMALDAWGLTSNIDARAALVNAPIYWTVTGNTGNFTGGNAANTISGFILTYDWTVVT